MNWVEGRLQGAVFVTKRAQQFLAGKLGEWNTFE